MRPAHQPTLYEDLAALPEGLTGEILDGQLHTQPRPTGSQVRTETELAYDLVGSYGRGRGGPSGWWILVEPEIHFVTDEEVAVPDLVGWRRERMPQIPQGRRFEVVPDWICEVVSPSTASKDREIKMPLYARYGVAFAWLVDPTRRTLETFRLEGREWRLLADASGDDRIAVTPFDALQLDLSNLWS